jgi:hypothetical protein
MFVDYRHEGFPEALRKVLFSGNIKEKLETYPYHFLNKTEDAF